MSQYRDDAHAGRGGPASTSPRGTDGLAIAALITSLLGLGPVAIVLGALALRRIRDSGTGGRVLAIAGIVIGSLGTVVLLVLLIAWLALLPTDRTDEPAEPAPLPAPTETPTEEPGTPTPTGPATTEPTPLPTEEADPAVVLSDILPLDVAGFTARELLEDTAVLDAGALEAYLVDYSNQQDDVLLAASSWASRADAHQWATGLAERYPEEDLQDSGPTDPDEDQDDHYWVYTSGTDDLTIIWTHGTTVLSLHGPATAVESLYQAYPL